MSTAQAAAGTVARRPINLQRFLTRHGWTVGVYILLVALLGYWSTIPKNFGSFDVQSLVADALPLTFAAMAQAVIVISGGIDLSLGSLMSVINVLAAREMAHQADGQWVSNISTTRAVAIAFVLVGVGMLMGAVTGALVVLSRVPDIIVTLAMLFVWAGLALVILEVPGGAVPTGFQKLLGFGFTGTPWLPTGLIVVAGGVLLFWVPFRRSRAGLAVYAVGSNRTRAYLSGVNVTRSRILAYSIGGGFAAMAGLAISATSGIGDPLSGQYYTLNSVAAVVLGGVSLLGGVGGIVGPIAAAFILTLVKTILILKGVDQNWAQVIQGALIIVVVMIGGLIVRQKGKSGT